MDTSRRFDCIQAGDQVLVVPRIDDRDATLDICYCGSEKFEGFCRWVLGVSIRTRWCFYFELLINKSDQQEWEQRPFFGLEVSS